MGLIIQGGGSSASAVAYINPMASGQYYGSVALAASGNIGLTLSTTYFMPVYIGRACTVDRIRANPSVAGTTGNVLRLGIYSDSVGKPGNLVLDAGTIDATTTGIKTITISQALSAGLYWLACNSQVGVAGSVNGTNNGYVIGLPGATASVAASSAYIESSIAGAFANVGSLATSTLQPLLSVRAA